MQRQGISYSGSQQIYGNPNLTGANYVNFASSNTRPQQVNVVSGSQVQGRQIISQQQPIQTQVQPTYVGSSDNYGYGFSQQKDNRNQEVYATSASIPRFENVQPSGNVQYSSQNAVGSGVRGGTFVVNPSNITTGRPIATVQSGSVVNPVSFVQPQTSTFVQPVTTTYVQPITTPYTQQQVTSYAQPITTSSTQQNQTYQPLQQTSSKAQFQTLGTKWAEQQFQRPKYPKLYNNSAQYYRNLAPEDDPTVKKTFCSPCCWVLVGLIGLLALVFGILCGLGIFCGGSFNFTLPSGGFGRNETATVAPTGPQQPVTPVQPSQPVGPVGPVTSTEIKDGYIDPSLIAKVPITTTSTQNWSTSTNQQTTTTGGSTTTYLAPSTDYQVDPSYTNKVPVETVATGPTYTNYPVTSPTYGYNLGYQPASTTSTQNYDSAPLSTNPEAWSPTSVDPITATYQ